ncbi:hypothetical protein GJ744_011488 [Endocarpon pusillum]|uniref:Amidoligase enzyme n=1 Tax=Endocarpon pusillum TaxID=364733 RepID=A0A8H7AFV8_9EURO|nr:hypothetical protein GJ744_011488 [Endocarpon pusillum]
MCNGRLPQHLFQPVLGHSETFLDNPDQNSGGSPTTCLESCGRRRRRLSPTTHSSPQPSDSTHTFPSVHITIADRSAPGRAPHTTGSSNSTLSSRCPSITQPQLADRGGRAHLPITTGRQDAAIASSSRSAGAGSAAAASIPVKPPTPSQASRPGIRLGIETEFLLSARQRSHQAVGLSRFVQILANNHNKEVSSQYPQMHHSLCHPKNPIDYKEWSMVYETSNATGREPWGLEMRSPIIDVQPGWRDPILATWRYLLRNYEVKSNHECATHIHISLVPAYHLGQVKKIASAVIYFEAVFEALVPEERRGNEWVQSNWLESPNLAQKDKSRSDSINEIERAGEIDAVLNLMQICGDPKFAWNFIPLTTNKQTIEFRKPPGSETADEALCWAELALNFIQASLRYGSFTDLKKFPQNIKGLRSFLGKGQDPKISDPDRLQMLWANQTPNAAIAPTDSGSQMLKTEEELHIMAAADIRRSRRHPRFE